MPVATQTQTSTSNSVGTLKLRSQGVPEHTPFPQLDENGFHVVKGAVPRERALQYANDMYKWMEAFGRGFKRDDRSTYRVKNIPAFGKGGLFNRHGCGQEQFAWDIRCEQGVIDAFAQIWGTEELLVSFDAVNLSLPFPKEEMTERGKPWPHVDQSPNRQFKHCIQGLVNLLPNGDNDGGLAVLDGSFKLYNEFFAAHEADKPADGWSWKDSHHFSQKHMQWFYDRGCKWKKINADPGDLVLWDSRCIHYGAAPTGDNTRAATYVCYKPAADVTPEVDALRKELMSNFEMTSHDPLLFRVVGVRGYGAEEENEQVRPHKDPILTHRAKQLAGLEPY